jgi:hypothetical protein
LRVVQGKSLGDTFDGVEQPLAGGGNLAQICFLDLDCRIAEYRQCLCHTANLVRASGREISLKVTAGDREHAVAERSQSGDKVAADIEPYDQSRADEAQCHDRD